MALRHLLMFCALTALALSGCASGAEEPAPVASAVPMDPSNAAAGEAPAEDTADALPTIAIPFSKEGTTWAGACVYTVAAYQCTPTPGNGWLIVEGEGLLQSVTGTVRWTPRADYELKLYLMTMEEDGWHWRQGDPVASSSTGLLEFDWDVAGDEVDEVLLSLNSYTGTGAMYAAASASVPFDFQMEGVALSAAS